MQLRTPTRPLALLGVALLAGCGGGGGGGGGGAAALSGVTAVTTFVVVSVSPTRAPAASTAEVTLAFSAPVEATSLQVGTTAFAFEDVDANPGGAFADLPGTFTPGADPTTLAFVPRRPFQDGREVRLVLTSGVRDQAGAPLLRGTASSALSFLGQVPDAVFEGRFLPTTTPAPATPPAAPPTTPPPASPPGAPATPPGQRPDVFQPEAGTDVWRLDFDLRAADFAQDLERHGLRSGDAATDALARDLIIGQALSRCSQKYLRTPDGKSVSGQSWRISFTARSPGGRPGQTHSREAVGGRHSQSGGILGASLYDGGNQAREDNSRAGGLGVFSRQIFGLRSVLDPPLDPSDRPYLEGSYRLGDGTAAEDARLQAILTVAADWGHAVGAVLAHEVGHSVGLLHDDTDPIGIMRTAAGAPLLSNGNSRMSATSAARLDRNLGRSP